MSALTIWDHEAKEVHDRQLLLMSFRALWNWMLWLDVRLAVWAQNYTFRERFRCVI